MFKQLVLGATTAGDTIVVLVSFLLLMVLLKKFAWKPLMNIMEQREQNIASNIENAEIAKNEAERLAAERQEKLDKTRAEAATVLNKARESAESAEKELLAAARVEASRLKTDAKKEIENERQMALASVRNDVSALSIQIAEKLIGKELTTEGHAELINEYIERLADVDETK
ncbi:F0F1 ATP synthase subunit B [Carnobacterium mobile]|uniref:F0F1 ATP synthase subunit B n=1 Tax=Carnobacterium mobile TaxID=2750 RepID=UPI000555AFBB|nr:F0F1 ATP synthase subunit B [Carnobacterium mobile]